MVEFRLSPRAAAGGAAALDEAVGPYRLIERSDIALASVACRRGHAETATAALSAFIGAPAPEAGRHAAGETYAAFWIAPGQWMISAPHDGHEKLARELCGALGAAVSVSEQNDGWSCFDLTGPEPPIVLERLSNVDAWAMQTGDAARTVIEHISCFLLCLEAGRSYRLLAPRSFARALSHAVLARLHSTLALGAARDAPPH